MYIAAKKAKTNSRLGTAIHILDHFYIEYLAFRNC